MLDNQTTQGSSLARLIDAQRKCSTSLNLYERIVGSLLIAARLQNRLSVFPDEEIGQLMFEHVWNVMEAFSPEMTICQEATERLLNASSVVKTTRENLNQ